MRVYFLLLVSDRKNEPQASLMKSISILYLLFLTYADCHVRDLETPMCSWNILTVGISVVK